MAAQPVGEFKHLDIAPHPGRETHEGFAAPWARGMVADIAVDVGGVRPVRLDRNDVEAVMRDQLPGDGGAGAISSEEHTSELQSLMRISYAVFCLKKKKNKDNK